jgi:FKBP-type peptidyl-prolyl cis-trans isomerase 2
MLDTNHPLAGAPLTLDITVQKLDKMEAKVE